MDCNQEDIMNDLVRKEVLWGADYRELKHKPIKPKHSPLVLTINKCRKHQEKTKCKLRQLEKEKGKRKLKRQLRHHLKEKCKFEPVIPRIYDLAQPNKRLVLANWKAYQDILAPEILCRFEDILKTTEKKILDPHTARYYFKHIDRKKRRLKRKKRRKLIRKKKQHSCIAGKIRTLTDQFVNDMKHKPLVALNCKQMIISDFLLTMSEESQIIRKKPKRTTKMAYKKAILEIADKMAEWIGDISLLVDIDKDLAYEPPELELELLEEGEEEEEEEEEGVEGDEGLGEWRSEIGEGEAGLLFEELLEMEKDLLGELSEGEGEAGIGDGLTDEEQRRRDLLERLIRIMEMSTPDHLEKIMNDETMPGTTYDEVLEKTIALRQGWIGPPKDHEHLESAILDWSLFNKPDEVDDDLRYIIHEVARYISFGLFGDFWTQAEDDFGSGVPIDEELIEKSRVEQVELSIMPEEDLTIGDLGDVEDLGDLGDVEDLGGLGDVEDLGDLSGIGEEIIEIEELILLEEEERVAAMAEELSIMGEELMEGYMSGEELGIGEEGEGLGVSSSIILKHKPSVTFEHDPNTICCLSLKIWAVWLLKICKNCRNWTRWIMEVTKKVRYYVHVVQGDVTLPNGQKRVLYKEEWRDFTKRCDEMVVAWRQYGAHVQELSDQVIAHFHGKEVRCCPKCLHDHLVKNVCSAHETYRALEEAIQCCYYWYRCLDDIVQETTKLNEIDGAKFGDEARESEEEKSSEESFDISIEELDQPASSSSSSEIEIEEIERQ